MSELARRRALGLGLALFALALALYVRTASFPFLEYDDPPYVRDNPHLLDGLGGQSLRWALTSTEYQYNWHPVTWLSHALDVSAFGLDAGRHHLVNALLHALNVVLVFGALRALGLGDAVAFLVAASFALHPLRVESVAWISQRKDLLAGTGFGVLLWTYGRYARAPSAPHYAAVLGALAFGLAAKPTLVTAPALLLLLDVWPLRRWRFAARRLAAAAPQWTCASAAPALAFTADSPALAPTRESPSPAPTRPGQTSGTRGGFALVLEKLPLLGLALVAMGLTWKAQSEGGAVNTQLDLAERLAHAPVALLTYLRQFVLPGGLSVFYPHPGLVGGGTPLATALGATAGLGVLLLAALRVARRQPWWIIGLLWFLGTLVPMIGLVQVGEQAHADRYAYLSFLGLELALASAGVAWAMRSPPRRPVLVVGALLALAGLAAASHRRLADWSGSRELFASALAQDTRNYVAHNVLGQLAGAEGDLDRALEHFEAARSILPGFYAAQINTGKARYRLKEIPAAQEAFESALRARPQSAEAHLYLAITTAALGDFAEADRDLRRALEIDPSLAREALYRETRTRLDQRLEEDR